MLSCKFTTLPVTFRAIQAISGKEPSTMQPCKGRSFSSINAVIYSLRTFTDPISSVCLAITHLFKAFYFVISYRRSCKTLKNSKIEALKATDYLLYGIFSSVFNAILAGKCFCGIIQPKICYRKATSKEAHIIHEFNEYKNQAYSLGKSGVKALIDLHLKSHVPEQIENLKFISEKIRTSYFKTKLYTV